jgi:iron complex outermembrane receptor protein
MTPSKARTNPKLALLVLGAVAVMVQSTLTRAEDQVPAENRLERVEVTGSSIKQIQGETALPVQTFTAADIAKTGVTSVTDLIQALPAMQGFTSNSQSVNGGGAGLATASLHAIGEKYTLVLLNGHRVAPYDSGSIVNLNTLPISAIERVEVLTDGASAIYGADAIAGVVNFITKKDTQKGEFSANYYTPEQTGGGSYSIAASKGFGDLSTDRFNLFFAGNYDHQDALFASQRGFSRTGILNFYDQGAAQQVPLVSSNSVPANIPNINLSDGSTIKNINLYNLANGSCPAGQVKAGKRCLFDYPSTVQNIGASDRVNLFSSGRFNLDEKTSFFGEASYSRFYNDPQYAAPAQPGLNITAAALATDINPLLAGLGHPGVTAVSGTYNLRLFDAGGRKDRYTTDTTQFVVGVDSSIGAWDLTGQLNHSVTKYSDKVEGGYASKDKFDALIASGAWDPLTSLAGTATGLVAPIVLHQTVDETKSTLDIVSGRATNAALFKLPAGDAALGLGFEYGKQKYADSPSAISQGKNPQQPTFTDAIIGGSGGSLPVDASRKYWGAFTELVTPILENLEATLSARYDHYDAVSNGQTFDINSKATGSRFQPSKELLFRGSYGTGFRAPSLNNIASPAVSFGNTGFQACPPGLETVKPAVAALCTADKSEYNIQRVGNPSTGADALKPEKSTQWTIGFRFEPSSVPISAGADLWAVNLRDRIDYISQDTAFSNGIAFANLFTGANDPINGNPTLTFLQQPRNLGEAHYKGVDVDLSARLKTSLGRLTTHLRGTYMIQADYQVPGLDGYQTSLGLIGPDTNVVFRYQLNLLTSLESGDFTHTLAINFKPGYMDDTLDYNRVDAQGNNLTGARGYVQGRYVGAYYLLDWQTRYAFSKAFILTGGIKNLANTDPPFSLIDQGGTGNARGFDGRYTDPIGRQYYISGVYRF